MANVRSYLVNIWRECYELNTFRNVVGISRIVTFGTVLLDGMKCTPGAASPGAEESAVTTCRLSRGSHTRTHTHTHTHVFTVWFLQSLMRINLFQIAIMVQITTFISINLGIRLHVVPTAHAVHLSFVSYLPLSLKHICLCKVSVWYYSTV